MPANLRPVAGAGVTAGGFGFTTGAAVDKIFISVVVGCGHQVCLVVGCGHQVFWPVVCLVVGCGHQVCLVVGCGHQVFLAVDGPAVGAMDDIVCFMVLAPFEGCELPLRTSFMVWRSGYFTADEAQIFLKSSESRDQTMPPPKPFCFTHSAWKVD